MSYDSDSKARHHRNRRERRRKERILHTRISEGLQDDLRRAAEELRVPVSNLVRNVLEEAVGVVEAVSDDFGELIDEVVESAEAVADRFKERNARRPGSHGRRWTEATRAAGQRAAHRTAGEEPRGGAPESPGEESPRGAPPAPGHAPILGWQPLVLNAPQHCACGRPLAAGEPAHVALTASGLSERYRCAGCVAVLGTTS